jgi:hypothetical protein
MAAPPEDKRPPMAVAMQWVSQITTVVLEMILPGVGGQWLDAKWGTSFLGLAGFALGLSVGVWHLVAMTRPRTPSNFPGDQQGGNKQ